MHPAKWVSTGVRWLNRWWVMLRELKTHRQQIQSIRDLVVRELRANARAEGTTEASYFTAAEQAKLVKYVTEGVSRVLFRTALRTGMRAAELLTLQWQNVDTKNGVIQVRDSLSRRQEWRPKSRTSRRDVYIDVETAKMLADWRKKSGGKDGELVFQNPDGTPLTPESVTKALLYPAMKRAGIPRVGGETRAKRTWHSLRHTYAATVLAKGASMYWLSGQLGHSSIRITEQTYAHLEKRVRREQAAALKGAFAA